MSGPKIHIVRPPVDEDPATDDSSECAPPKTPQALELVHIALERYRMGRTTEGEPFAVELEGPNIARMLRGGRDSLRAELARVYYDREGKVAGQTALASALLLLEGEAQQSPAEAVHLRVARQGESIVLDLGAESGRAVIVEPGHWHVADRSPVLFRRTELTGALPEPARNEDFQALWGLINIPERTRPLVLAWLVNALMPGLEYLIVLLGGQQGTGKSSTAEVLAELIDPSPAPLRCAPRDLEQWAVQAAGSRVVAVDNLSRIDEWLSDALCRAATGDGMVRRRLYSDSGLTVLAYSRAVILTSIDAGALRGDLGERLLLLDLDPIPPDRRRRRSELRELLREERPTILGSLLGLLAQVLRRLPDVHLAELGRMADFERVLAAVDAELGTGGGGLRTYRDQGARVSEDIVEGDPVAVAVRSLAARCGRGGWSGTATELLDELTPADPPRGWPPRRWPSDASRLGGTLRRLIPALEGVGIHVIPPAGRDRPRLYRVRSAPEREGSCNSVGSAASDGIRPAGPVEADLWADAGPDADREVELQRRGQRSASDGPGDPARADSDAADAADAAVGSISTAGGLEPL